MKHRFTFLAAAVACILAVSPVLAMQSGAHKLKDPAVAAEVKSILAQINDGTHTKLLTTKDGVVWEAFPIAGMEPLVRLRRCGIHEDVRTHNAADLLVGATVSDEYALDPNEYHKAKAAYQVGCEVDPPKLYTFTDEQWAWIKIIGYGALTVGTCFATSFCGF